MKTVTTDIKILIAEDDRNTLPGLIEILRMEGYDVVGVENARLALKQLVIQQFDILLTDLKMPDMNGVQLHLKALKTTPRIKTILMTAFSTALDNVEAKKQGIFKILLKPIDLELLFVSIRNAVGQPVIFHQPMELQQATYKSDLYL